MDNDMGGGGTKELVTRMTVGGDNTELQGDDEISIVSDDRGDEEVTPNQNIWSRFGVQA